MRGWLPPALLLLVPAFSAIAFIALRSPEAAQRRSAEASAAPVEVATPAPTLEAIPAAPSAASPASKTAAVLKERVRVAYEIGASDIKSQRELDRYLDSLEAQARKNRAVTALELQPGFMAIKQASYLPDQDARMKLLGEFGERMNALSAELRNDPPDQTAMPRLDDIRRASAGERQELIEKYLDATRRLPAEQRAEANRELEQLINHN